MVGTRFVPTAKAVSWGSPTAIPGADPAVNSFPKLLPTNNGSTWLVWDKEPGTYGEIYLMTTNQYGWSGQIPIVNSSGVNDDITPTVAQLNNGTIVLVWSRGVTGSGGCYSSSNGFLYSLYTESYTQGKWTKPTVLVQTPDDNTPALTKLMDGRLFLTWNRCTKSNGYGDIYYKTFNGTWSPESLVVGSTCCEEKLPSVTQTNDGKVWLFYSTNVNSGINYIYYTTWNGATWTTPVQFTSSATSNDDDWATVAEDRSGTMWVFFSRLLSNGTVNGVPTYQYDMFYRNSTNLGSTWSPEQTIAPNVNSGDEQPYVVQNSDKKLWLVYSSNQRLGNPYGTFNLYLIVSPIIGAHDPTLTSISVPSQHLRSGESVNVTVQVNNAGDFTESPQVSYYANSSLVTTGQITVPAGQTLPLILSWYTTGQPPGFYKLQAILTPVTGQISTANTSMNSTYVLLPSGDVNRDGKVNVFDLSLIGSHFGALQGMSTYYRDADLNKDGKINIFDLTLCASSFGQTVSAPDLAVLSVSGPTPNPRVGELVPIKVVVADLGYSTAPSTLSLYVNQVLLGTQTVNLAPSQNQTYTFNWNSTNHAIGHYAIGATVAPIPGELSTTNNSLNSTFTLVSAGDVNRDGKVDVVDLSLIGSHFGATPTSANWYPDADLNHDGIINIFDLSICANDFGQNVT